MAMFKDVLETVRMIEKENLDIRTITMGISLMDCIDADGEKARRKIYDKITRMAEHLVSQGERIETEFGIPIVNKRVSVTPISLIAGASSDTDYVAYAETLDKAAHEIGVNFIGGFSALVPKGFTRGDLNLINSIPEALACTERVCSSVNLGSTKTGINMDAVKMMGEIVKQTAYLTRDEDSIGCAKLVVFCNAVEDNPFMAGAYHGIGQPDTVLHVGVSGPGVVKKALEKHQNASFDEMAEIIKKTAFKITRAGQLVGRGIQISRSRREGFDSQAVPLRKYHDGLRIQPLLPDIVQIRFDEPVASFHPDSLFHKRLKTFPVQLYRVDSDVDQHVNAAVRRDAYGVFCRKQQAYRAVTGGINHTVRRIYGDAVAQSLGCENRIVRLLYRQQFSVHGRIQERCRGFCCRVVCVCYICA